MEMVDTFCARCGDCGYLLAGLGECGKCPECGGEFGVGEMVLWGRMRTWEELSRGTKAVVMLYLLGLSGYVLWSGYSKTWAIAGGIAFSHGIALGTFGLLLCVMARQRWQVRISAEGYGRRIGAGKLRMRKWNGEDVGLRRLGRDWYELKIADGLMCRLQEKLDLKDEDVVGLRGRIEKMSGRRVELER